MKHLMLPICLLFSFLSIGQKTVDIIIPKDDGSPFKEPIKYLWGGKNNRITSNYMGDFRIIKVWTDNGNIDSGDYYLTNYAIIPQRTGIVNVYSIQEVWNGKKIDTIQTKNTFKAIKAPSIFLKLKSEQYSKDTTISFTLIDSLTSKPINKRYKIGRFFEPEIFDNNGNSIGQLTMCSGTEISLTDPIQNSSEIRFKKGYKIKIVITIRDMKTDLLIPTKEFVYTIK